MWKKLLDVIIEELYAVALHVIAVVISLLEFMFWLVWVTPRLVWRQLRQLTAAAFA